MSSFAVDREFFIFTKKGWLMNIQDKTFCFIDSSIRECHPVWISFDQLSDFFKIGYHPVRPKSFKETQGLCRSWDGFSGEGQLGYRDY